MNGATAETGVSGLTAKPATAACGGDSLQGLALLVLACLDFDMERDRVGAGVEEPVAEMGRLRDHQVRIDGQRSQPAHGGHDLRAEGDVVDEVPVHDVEVHAVDARPLQLANDAIQVAEVGGQDAGGNLNAVHWPSTPLRCD